MPDSKPLKSQAPKIRIRQDLYSRVDDIADARRKEGVTKTSIVEDALKRWLQEYDTAGTSSTSQSDFAERSGQRESTTHDVVADGDRHRWHRMLDEILDSEVEEFVRAIIANLEGWSRAARLRAGGADIRDPASASSSGPAGAIRDLDRAVKRAQARRKRGNNAGEGAA